jgi:glycosyltransferase involved in cell wall biosynthesis
MEILILTDVFFPDTIGGAGRVAYHVGFGLSQKGHDVHIITRNTGGKFIPDKQLAPNIRIHRFDCPIQESLSLIISEIKGSYSLAKRLTSQIDFDVICTHQSLVAIGPLRSKRIKKLPIIYYYHSPWHEEYLIKNSANGKIGIKTRLIAYIMRWIEGKIVNKADKVVVLSDYMRKKVSQLHHYPGSKIVKIPGGVDINRFHLPEGGKITVKKDLHLPQDKTVFLTIRNLVSRMGLETLIKAFHGSEILKKEAVLLIGGEGPLGPKLRLLIFDYKLQDTVRLLGHVPDDDLPTFYQAADFFVLPTEKLEGFGLVILEAMACGTPVLGTPVGAIPKIIESFDKKLIFKSPDPSDIRYKLEDILNSSETYRYSSNVCRDFVKKNFSWEKVVEMFEKIMKSQAM